MSFTAQFLLDHSDTGQLWPSAPSLGQPALDLATAYQRQLEVRALRIGRGELPRGFKVGFTNRSIWARYAVFAPIWGSVWNTSLFFCTGKGELSLEHCAQPRIEPELVFGMRAQPAPNASLQDLFDAIDWVAPGFEIVQSHLSGWKFAAPDCVADGSLHARLLVGRRIPLRELARDAAQLDGLLAGALVSLCKGATVVETGQGANVLDSPLRALHYFLNELRQCPGAPDLMAGDVVTTGTWTDAWPVAPGEHWAARFGAPLASLEVTFR